VRAVSNAIYLELVGSLREVAIGYTLAADQSADFTAQGAAQCDNLAFLAILLDSVLR